MITSLNNPQVKLALKLRERRHREKNNLFLIEGYRELQRAAIGKQALCTLLFCPELFLGSNEMQLISEFKAKKLQCTEKIFRKLSYRDRPDGLLAIAPQQHRNINCLVGDFFVVAESIEKPGNLGTILRSSDAAGVNGVIICDRCTDLYNPNVVRASVGTLFTLPIVEASKQETLLWLKKEGIQLVAASPHAKKTYDEVDFTGPVAIIVGSEQYGLTHEWIELASNTVRIPMLGRADSLNVSVATTLLLYEVVKQRKSPSSILR